MPTRTVQAHRIPKVFRLCYLACRSPLLPTHQQQYHALPNASTDRRRFGFNTMPTPTSRGKKHACCTYYVHSPCRAAVDHPALCTHLFAGTWACHVPRDNPIDVNQHVALETLRSYARSRLPDIFAKCCVLSNRSQDTAPSARA